uniref:Phage shock protein B n=1 Tax=Pseudomonas phage HRDY3 TaxID=3236930 RepID=A0AB39CEQ0_9VIRU
MSEELIKWLIFAVPVLVVGAFVLPEVLRCWKLHMEFKQRKARMDAEVRMMEAVAALARALNGDKKND